MAQSQWRARKARQHVHETRIQIRSTTIQVRKEGVVGKVTNRRPPLSLGFQTHTSPLCLGMIRGRRQSVVSCAHEITTGRGMGPFECSHWLVCGGHARPTWRR